ncbi:hypothetical protein EMIT0P12_20803 [Pseudomonas sp. IT-P12]
MSIATWEGAQSGVMPLMSPETGLIQSSGITVGDARLLAVCFCACPPLSSLNGELP